MQTAYSKESLSLLRSKVTDFLAKPSDRGYENIKDDSQALLDSLEVAPELEDLSESLRGLVNLWDFTRGRREISRVVKAIDELIS